MAEHVLTCQDSQATQQFQDLMEKLDGWMGEAKMAPERRTITNSGLIHWKEG